MARVTVEDCVDAVESRFNLVLIASERVKQLKDNPRGVKIETSGKESLDVTALREIADGKTDAGVFKDTASLLDKDILLPNLNFDDGD